MKKYLELKISSKDATSSTYSFFFSLLNLIFIAMCSSSSCMSNYWNTSFI